MECCGEAWSPQKPYKGMRPALNDLAGGHIAMMTSPIPLALPLAHSGKVRMLGVTTKERVGAIADVPPLAEIGVPGRRSVVVDAGGAGQDATLDRRQAPCRPTRGSA